ncbi:MAG: hypothetical protein WCO93_05580 [bacterium]
MKSTTVILAAALTLSVNILFAESIISSIPVPSTRELSTVNNLVPVTPAEANFEDAITPEINNNELTPFTPGEAEFEDVTVEMFVNQELAPVTPSAADFE